MVGMMEYSEDLLIADNRRLVQKLKELEEKVVELEGRDRTTGGQRYISESYGGPSYEAPQRFEDEEDTIESVMYCISATEELCGISVYDYKSTVLPPSEGLPPGKWREISMNMLILDSLKTAITVIRGEQNGADRILSLECVAGETTLVRNELSGLITECCNSTPPQCEKLLTCLAEYARISAQRHAVIKAFRESHHNNVKIQTSEENVLMQWRGRLFEISWSLQWCGKTEKMQNMISVEIGNYANPVFMRESEASLRRLTEFTTSPESRLECLQEIAKNVLTYN